MRSLLIVAAAAVSAVALAPVACADPDTVGPAGGAEQPLPTIQNPIVPGYWVGPAGGLHSGLLPPEPLPNTVGPAGALPAQSSFFQSYVNAILGKTAPDNACHPKTWQELVLSPCDTP